MLHVAEEHIDSCATTAVNVTQTVLVDFDATWNTLAVECGSNEDEVEVERLTGLEGDELVLFYDIFQLLLLLITSDDLLLQFGDVLGDLIDALDVLRAESQAANEVSVGILERLIILSANTLTRRKEVDSKGCDVGFWCV